MRILFWSVTILRNRERTHGYDLWFFNTLQKVDVDDGSETHAMEAISHRRRGRNVAIHDTTQTQPRSICGARSTVWTDGIIAGSSVIAHPGSSRRAPFQ